MSKKEINFTYIDFRDNSQNLSEWLKTMSAYHEIVANTCQSYVYHHAMAHNKKTKRVRVTDNIDMVVAQSRSDKYMIQESNNFFKIADRIITLVSLDDLFNDYDVEMGKHGYDVCEPSKRLNQSNFHIYNLSSEKSFRDLNYDYYLRVPDKFSNEFIEKIQDTLYENVKKHRVPVVKALDTKSKHLPEFMFSL